MIKYRLPYKSFDNNDWLLTIDIPTYAGDPIDIRGVAGNAGRLMFDGGVDDQWDNPIVNVMLSSEVYNQGQIDVQELQLIEDRQCVVTLTRNSEVKFKGYLIADNMQSQFTSPPYNVSISASCGLNLLESISYLGFGAELGARVPLNYFRRILCNPNNLGIDLPLRWTKTVEALESAISGDAFEKAVWSAYGEGFASMNIKTGQYNRKDCRYIIEGLTKALKCRVLQADGAWWILGIKESLADVVNYRECALSTGIPVITEHSRNCKKHIGGEYKFVMEDSLLTIKPALSEVVATYDHEQRDNILPNGGQDIYSFGSPMWWTNDHIDLFVSEYADITGQGGRATELRNTGGVEHKFYLVNSLPIDANILYRRLTWGFSFLPIAGFDVDQNGFIDWKNKKVKTSVKYTVNESGVLTDYYLNEFGYWGNKNSPAHQQVVGTDWNTSADTFNIMFDQVKNFYVGDQVRITFVRGGNIIRKTVRFEETMDVDSGTEYIVTKIQDGFTTSPNAWTVSINNTDNSPLNSAYTEKVEDYYKYIYFDVDKLKLNDPAAVTYRGASNLDVYIFDPGKLDPAPFDGMGMLSVEFHLAPTMQLILDDVWMKLDSNQDQYQIINTGTKNANKQEIELRISSAFSGFYVSNFMRAYYNSNTDWRFTDGVDTGSLTDLYARAVMRSRYKASYIFNGTISTRGYDWSFLDNYTIETLDEKKFIPLNPAYNTETNEVNLIAIEDRSDDIPLGVTHRGSNNNDEI